MMRRKLILAVAPMLLVALAGCATVNPSLDYERARNRVAATTAVSPAIVPEPTDTAVTPQHVESYLEGGLSIDEAVEVALLNNKTLRAAFFEIGVSRAELVQSGLLSNPSLGAVVRFPRDGGDATVEARLAWNLIDLWHRPARKRVQERRLEHTVLQVAHDTAELVGHTKAAYIRAVASQGARAVEEDNLTSTEEFLQLTLARGEAGAAAGLEVNAARGERLEQEVVLRSARLAENEAKLRLAALLGLNLGPEELALTSPTTPSSTIQPSLEALTTSALSYRLDLWAAKETARAFEAAASLERRLLFPSLEAGVELEARGDEFDIGPGVDLEIPLFDQNRAQVSKATLRQQQAEATVEALTVSTRQQVRTAYERLVSTLETERAYREQIAPLRESSLELARESFRAGRTGFLSVLEAQKELLSARREANSWARTAALALVALETASGRPLSQLLGQSEP